MISTEDGDTALEQFSEFCEEAHLHEKLTSFQPFSPDSDETSERLDTVLESTMSKSYPTAWRCVKDLLLLSHSQATVERGFSINKEIMTTNLSEMTLTSRRLVKDYINLVGGVTEILMTRKLSGLAKQAYYKYKQYQENKREEKAKIKRDQKRKAVEEELTCLKKRKESLLADAESLLSQSYKLYDKSETTGCNEFVVRANSFRSAKDKQEEAKNLAKLIKSKVAD